MKLSFFIRDFFSSYYSLFWKLPNAWMGPIRPCEKNAGHMRPIFNETGTKSQIYLAIWLTRLCH
jgi:hypothetical protein